GIRQGVQHLAALGHRQIGFISGPMRLNSARLRSAAFLQALEECGIVARPEWNVEGDHTLEGGIKAMDKILESESRPTAVMCSNDMTAIGVLHKAFRVGLRVPADLSVIGYDDIQMARVTIPPLTSIHMSRVDLANAAVNALKAHIVEGGNPQHEYKIDTRLVVRESTAYPAGTMSDLKSSGPGAGRSGRSS
ncbi:MAG: substrate-binding domain-containing protein, partial [Terracidiphilus sp.]